MLKRIKSDSGFMGHTHALSAVAVYLLLAAFVPKLFFSNILHTENILIFIVSIFIVAGAATLPDLDNTKSTAISTLGIIGQLLSKTMRGLSVAIYMAVKGERDDSTPNPHRGFWHTLVSSVVLFFFVLTTTSIPGYTTLPIIDKKVSISFLIACLWIYICLNLAMAGLFGEIFKKYKKSFMGNIIVTAINLAFTVSVLLLAPSTLSYKWIAYVMALGYIIHILGDTLTVAGTPLLWPYKNKGKRWWTYRLLKIRAGGSIENMVFVPLFSGLIILSLIRLLSFIIK